MTSKWRCVGKQILNLRGGTLMRTILREKMIWPSLVFLHIVFTLTIDFIPSSAKTRFDAFNLGYFMDDFNEFKIQGIPNILIIDC